MASSLRTLAVTILGVALAAATATLAAAEAVATAAAGQQKPDAQKPDPQKPGQPSQPVFRAGINFVRVDVIVSDKQGKTVADLKQSDFEVTEDGKPQTIETFKLVKLDGGAVPAPDGPPRPIRTDFDEESEAARDDVRLFAIFLDDYHVRRGTSMAVRAPLDALRREPARAVRHGRADVPARVDLVAALHAQPRRDRQGDRAVHRPQVRVRAEERRSRSSTRITRPTTVEQIRNQVSLSALKGLIIHMGSLKEGRKALILVSEGYTNMLPPQLRNPVATMPGLGNPAAGNPMAGVGDPNEDRARFFSSMDLETDLREVYDTANRNNVAIYAVDPRGLAGFEYDINEGVNMPDRPAVPERRRWTRCASCRTRPTAARSSTGTISTPG